MSSLSSTSPVSPISAPDPRRWLALAVILTATLLGVLDFLIVNIALPSIGRDLGATPAQQQLTVAVYSLAFAVSLILGGRLGDLYGRKRMFQVGMAGFTFASLLCGFSQSPMQLVVFRVIQGTLAALMVPQVLATIQVTFDGRERDLATGISGAVVGVGSFLGNVLGGFLVQADLFGLKWRPIFFVNVPIGIVAIVLAAFLMQESRSDARVKLDWVGALVSGLALFCLVFPIAVGREEGFPLWAWAMMGASLVLTWGFFRYERDLAKRGGVPLVAMELFESRGYGRGLFGIMFLWFGASSFSFVVTQFLQDGLRTPPGQVGVIFAGLSTSFLVSSLLAVKLMERIGTKTLLVGLTIMQIGQIAMMVVPHRIVDAHLSPFWLMPILFLYGIGQGMCMPQVTRQTLNQVGKTNAGAASGVLSTAQQVASTLGISIVSSVFFAFAMPKASPAAQADPDLVAASFARGLTAAFVCNFTLLLVMRFILSRNLKLSAIPASVPAAVVVEP